MTNILYTLRKLYRVFLLYQDINSPKPIAIYANPDDVSLEPGIKTAEIKTTNCTGETVTALSYPDGIEGMLTLSFPSAGPELESLFLGRTWEKRTNVSAPVLLELNSSTDTFAPKTTGYYGYTIAAQIAATTQAKAYYVDPVTKLSTDIEIVDAVVAGDTNSMTIGDGGGGTLSSDLIGQEIQAVVPAIFPQATMLTGNQIGLISAYILGINFDGTARVITARNLSVEYGESLKTDPKRQIKFKILRDDRDGTGLGFSMWDLPVKIAC